jgi:hypothetical protein
VALLALVAILVYGENARHGGWVGDAWATRAWYVLYPHQDFFSTVGHFLDLNSSMAARPANAVYRVALNDWLGGNTSAWFVWQAVSCVCMCLALYALLRETGAAHLDAVAIAVLVAVFPASASLWLWSPVIHASLAIALAALGFLFALRAFRSGGRKAFALHAASLFLFVVSLLLYEVCLPLFLASVLLYALRAPWREAVRRWLVDCVVLLPLALLVSSSTDAKDQGVSGAIEHAGTMAEQLPTLLFERLLSLGSVSTLAVVILVAVYAAGFATIKRRSPEDPARARLRRFFALTGAGAVVIVLGYLIYVPGLTYYLPLARGIGDRVNAVAGIGWVICLYAFGGMVATLATLRLRRAALAASIGTAALALALGLSWLAPIADESRGYVAANREGERVLRVVERAVPDPPRGSVIWTFGQPVEASVGIPIFANYWNMTAAVQLTYHDRHVRSFVALPGTSFECRPEGVVPGGNPEYPPPALGKLGYFGSRYGRTYFVDTERGQFARVESPQQCVELRRTYALSPELPPES